MGKGAFDKFINKPDSGSKKKEKIRQEKKKVRAEKNAWFDEQKRLAKQKRQAENQQRGDRRTSARKTKPEEPKFANKNTAGKKEFRTDKRNATTQPRETGRFQRTNDKNKRSRPAGNDRQQFQKSSRKPAATDRLQFQKTDRKPAGNDRPQFQKTDRRPAAKDSRTKPVDKKVKATDENDEMPLNKLIAWCGVCGRREAVDLIKAGKVTVNGEVITSPPHRVKRTDAIKVNGKKVSVQKNLIYILLNKPKDYLTTTDDPEGRKTVMDLVRAATTERVFPVGRLDRNTTGVLLLTNDGEVAQRMTHPKYEVKKIYEVKLDKLVTKQQLDTIANGIKLDDGFIQPDAVAYADVKDKSIIGIEIHSGRNRIVRRIFEKMGFKVKNLDRVMYGIFTKKNVDRGKWRFLSDKEIRLLKHLNTSFAPKKRTADRDAS